MPKAPSVLQDKEADVPDIAPVYPHVLRVPPKPVRGPLHHRPSYWDGQRPEKHMRDASTTTSELQERLTQQILVALQTLLGTNNVAVSIDAVHYCVKARGIRDATSATTTTSCAAPAA